MHTATSILMQAPRVPHAMASDRLMPERVTRVNAGGTPSIALIVSAVVTIGLVVTGTFATVIAISAFFFVLQYASTFLAVFVLRRREPELPRPYKAWGYPVVPAIVLLGALAFLAGSFVTDRTNALHSVVVLLASLPAYFVVKKLGSS